MTTHSAHGVKGQPAPARQGTRPRDAAPSAVPPAVQSAEPPATRTIELSAARSRTLLTAVITAVLTALSAGVIAAPAHAAPQTATIDGIDYSVGEDPAHAIVTGYDGSQGTDLTIPDAVPIDGVQLPVNAIADGALRKKGLTSVDLPEGLRSIGVNAIAENELTSVALPTELTHLGAGAFGFNELASLVVPPSLAEIPELAFSNNRLTSVVLPAGLALIGNQAFSVNRLTALDLPNTLTEIGMQAFAFNELASVEIPGSVSEIRQGAFVANPTLTSVTIGDGVLSIGLAAFAQSVVGGDTMPCNITSLDLGITVTDIVDSSFAGCKLTSLTVPDSMRHIGFMAFSGNPLTSVDLGSGVQSLGSLAFQATKLTEITIPASATSIYSAFYQTSTLKTVHFLGAPPSDVNEYPLSPSTSAHPSITYPWRFGTDAGYTGGFTSPLWLDKYPSTALATVDFDLHGHGDAVPAQDVETGDHATKPSDPSEADQTFMGWYADADYTTPFDFDAAITRDTTAHAKWQPEWVRVHYDTGGHGTVPTDLVLRFGLAVPRPAAPSEAGWTFTGWYTSPALTVPFDFTAATTGDTTLYAGWSLNHYPVDFELQGHGAAIPATEVDHGSAVAEPEAPTEKGWTFTGWYADAALTTPYDFDAPVTAPLTVYAGWKENAAPTPTPDPQPKPQPQPQPQNDPKPQRKPGDDRLSTTGGSGTGGLPAIALLAALAGGVLLIRRSARRNAR